MVVVLTTYSAVGDGRLGAVVAGGFLCLCLFHSVLFVYIYIIYIIINR